MGNKTKKIAVVLAGAVAKGAFEAGALQALARTDVEILRIVATSSGALTGTVLASAVRTGELVAGTDRIAAIWRDNAEWAEVFHLSVRDIAKRDGLSDQTQLRALLRNHVPLTRMERPNPVELRLVVAPLGGREDEIVTRTGTRKATTFEAVCDFHSEHFGSRDGLDAVFSAAVASAAFPLVFAPVEIDGLGPCVDGGAVNNTPLQWALDGPVGAQLDAVVVIASSVEHLVDPPGSLTGLSALAGHLAEILIGERLYRDLRGTEQVNLALDRLDQLVRDQVLDAEQLRRVKQALDWSGRRQVDIVAIQPDKPLDGSAFGGFFQREQRIKYLEAGLDRGLQVLGQARWPHRPEAPPSVRHDDVVVVAADPVVLPGPVERDRTE